MKALLHKKLMTSVLTLPPIPFLTPSFLFTRGINLNLSIFSSQTLFSKNPLLLLSSF